MTDQKNQREGGARPGRSRARGLAMLMAVLVALGAGCGRRQLDLDLQVSVLHDKPRIAEVSYTVQDSRRDGGAVTVDVELNGDPGLLAFFDISPGIARREPMREVVDGRYEARFVFPPGTVGGPYTVTGRLSHDDAGEVVQRSPDSFTIGLVR